MRAMQRGVKALAFAGAEAIFVQRRSDLAEGLRVEQLVDLAHYFCICASELHLP